MIQFGDAAKNRIVPVGESMVQKAVDSKYLKELKTKELFSGKKGEAISSLGYFGEGLVLVGLEKTATPDEVRRAVHLGIEEIKKAKETEVLIDVALFPKNKNTFRAILEGALFSSYERIKLVKDWKPREAVKVVIANAPADAEKTLEEVRNVIEGVFLARNLVNEPALTMTPARFSVKMQSKLTPLGVEVNILGRAEIAELGMSAFLSVAMGSAEEPRLVVMRYLPLGKDVAPTVLVGKGLTYDSGGYSIKPTDGMLTMHCDMGGAGTITAGAFLEEFVGDTPWRRLDIAGTAYLPESRGYEPKDATGVCVRTLYEMIAR